MTPLARSRMLTLGLVAAAVAASAYLLFAPRPEPPPQSRGEETQGGPSGEAHAVPGAGGAGPRASDGVATAPTPTAEPDGAPTTLPVYERPVRDRARADLLREALAARLAVEATGSGGTAPMPAPQGEGNQVDTALGDYVADVMQEQFAPLATSCYEALLDSNPEAEGAIVLAFSIVGDPSVGGVVLDVELAEGTTLKSADFATCITESMYAVVFRAPPTGHPTVTVKQSFEFAP